jgi:hypothetical protein
MLSRAEQQRLRKIEELLLSEDPRFAQRFDSAAATVGSRTQRRGLTAPLWLIAGLAVAIVSVLVSSAALAVVALITMGVSVAMWLTA